jgi:hypothetical protein
MRPLAPHFLTADRMFRVAQHEMGVMLAMEWITAA